MKPKLVIMAAGLGSRYGGLKQIESVTAQDEIILDFSVYDAWNAGFKDVIFIIRPDMEEIFKERILSRMKRYVNATYVFQDISQIPLGYSVPEGRDKPWGTCHAVMAARDLLDESFAVINADDYYGRDAFKKVFYFLSQDNPSNMYCMVGYYVENTLSMQGTVTRGVCQVDSAGFLSEIKETPNIGWIDNICKCIGAKDATGKVVPINHETVVSMNFWGFKHSMLDYMIDNFPAFLSTDVKVNPNKAEYLLPIEVGKMIKGDSIRVKVLESEDKWYGITYKEDKDKIIKAFKKMKSEGMYPEKMWT